MKRSVAVLFCFCIAGAAGAASLDLPGPDGSIVFRLAADAQGHLVYSIQQNSRVRLEPARAGVTVNEIDLGAGAALGAPQSRAISEVFSWRGNKTSATNYCLAYQIPVQAKGANWVLEARVFNDGVGFRYRVSGEGKRRVQGEATSWRLPKDARVWYQTDTANYEGVFRSSRADQVPLDEVARDKQRPVHIGPPLTIEFADGTFGLVSEAALYNYSGLTLRPTGDARFQAAFQDDPQGWSNEGQLVSPWRVTLLVKDLHALVNSDLIPALCDPPEPELFPEGMNTAWIRPGKAPCTWMVYGNDGARWDKQKWFVDVAAATGCEYLLVDAGWRTEKWGWMKNGGDVWARAAELCRYAAERKVDIVLWHAFPDGRDDGPGLTTVEAREELFRNCQKAGVKGIKIDFFDSESKQVIDAYEDLLRRSAKYQLLINFHGANKPTGESRTWPHEITREGIREQEYVLWDSLPLTHYGALPFTRMAVGHADFLPGYVQARFLKNTTPIFQMACVLVFSSPFLCWPDNPEAYLNSPLLQIVRTVAVIWDETRILPGSVIGETVLMARRKGTSWYVAALNCKPESRELELNLAGIDLAGMQLRCYQDGERDTGCRIEEGVRPPENGRLTVKLRGGGGFIAHIDTPKKFAGWR